jgi:broad specificity phosphatase PhoE
MHPTSPSARTELLRQPPSVTLRPKLYYIRHGLTDWNVEGRLQGWQDVPLNDDGRAQARRCGEILRDLFAREARAPQDYDYISSPLRRARDSMAALRKVLGLPGDEHRVDPRLAEISFGEWEGLTYADVLARDQDIVDVRESNKWTFVPPGGESYAQLARRVGTWLDTVERDTVIAAHGGTGRALVAVLGIAPPDAAAHHEIDQGVVYLFAGNALTRYE